MTETSTEPVRIALLADARADARALLARTEREAALTLDQARDRARAILDEARRQGEEDGTRAARDVRVRARREADRRRQAARHAASEELGRRAVDTVRAFRYRPDYPRALRELERRARRLLSPDAEIAEQRGGGLLALAPGRRLDGTLDALAAWALDQIGAEVATLWEP
jgi:hypothetical protein